MINQSMNSNYLKNGKTLTGKMYFGNDGFSFKAQSVNGTIDYGKLKYNQIKEINLKNTFGIIPNGLQIIMKDNSEYLFVPMNRKKVREFLVSMMIKN